MGNLSQNLIILRKNNNLTQDDIANKVFVSRQAVSKWERGESVPDIETLVALSELYGVSIDDMLKSDLSAKDLSTAPANDNRNFDELKTLHKKQSAKLMTIWCVLLFCGYALICGIIHTACVNVTEHIWIIYFTLPVVPPIVFAIRFRHEIGKKWLMFFVNIPFISGIIYMLTIIAGNYEGAWIAFLLIPAYYLVAVLFFVYRIRIERANKNKIIK